ncbi:hypothetical protein EAE99_007979 [Botrytis elliptica]|nr:hypothetical protein EAE99_007979 [Botrytis elliptica]
MSELSKSRTPFSDLPIELRLVFWSLAISPRVVGVRYNYAKESCVSKDIPSLLLVSHEARVEALQSYEKGFGTRNKVHSKIYFNYELDTVDFDWKSLRDSYPCRHMLYHEYRCRIKRIRCEVLISSKASKKSLFRDAMEVW